MEQVVLPSKPHFTTPIDIVFQGYRDMGREEVEGAGVGLFVKAKPSDNPKTGDGGYVSVEEQGRKFYKKRGRSTADKRYFNASMRMINHYLVNWAHIRTVFLSDPRGTGALVLEWARNNNKPVIMIPKNKMLDDDQQMEQNLYALFSTHERDGQERRPEACIIFPKNGATGFHLASDWIKTHNADNPTGKIIAFKPPTVEGLAKIIPAIRAREDAARAEARAKKSRAKLKTPPKEVLAVVGNLAAYQKDVADAKIKDAPFTSERRIIPASIEDEGAEDTLVTDFKREVPAPSDDLEASYSLLSDEDKDRLRAFRSRANTFGSNHEPMNSSARKDQLPQHRYKELDQRAREVGARNNKPEYAAYLRKSQLEKEAGATA